jgi:hypothetical protein
MFKPTTWTLVRRLINDSKTVALNDPTHSSETRMLTKEAFDSMWEIDFKLEEPRENCNLCRPHNTFSFLTPINFTTK